MLPKERLGRFFSRTALAAAVLIHQIPLRFKRERCVHNVRSMLEVRRADGLRRRVVNAFKPFVDYADDIRRNAAVGERLPEFFGLGILVPLSSRIGESRFTTTSYETRCPRIALKDRCRVFAFVFARVHRPVRFADEFGNRRVAFDQADAERKGQIRRALQKPQFRYAAADALRNKARVIRLCAFQHHNELIPAKAHSVVAAAYHRLDAAAIPLST